MVVSDFEYDGERLSDYGFIIGYLNTSSDNSVSFGNKLTWNTVQSNKTNISYVTNASYSEVYSCTFDIIKGRCDDMNDHNVSDIELRRLMKWLNKKKYCKFKPIYSDGSYSDIYFKGSFNVTGIIAAGNIVGATLTFQSNAPFGFGEEILIEYELDSDEQISVFVDSDEKDYVYPKYTIECHDDGDLEIENKSNGQTISILNCKQNEIITIDSICETIDSYVDDETMHKNLYNDFNYEYPMLINYGEYDENIISVNMPCKIAISYAPIRKVGVIV